MGKYVGTRISEESYMLLEMLAAKLGKSLYETARIALVIGVRLLLYEDTLLEVASILAKTTPTFRKRILEIIRETEEI